MDLLLFRCTSLARSLSSANWIYPTNSLASITSGPLNVDRHQSLTESMKTYRGNCPGAIQSAFSAFFVFSRSSSGNCTNRYPLARNSLMIRGNDCRDTWFPEPRTCRRMIEPGVVLFTTCSTNFLTTRRLLGASERYALLVL